MTPKFNPGDKVRLKDFSDIENFTAGWTVGMYQWIGTIATIESVNSYFSDDKRIGYNLAESTFTWDERAMELVEENSSDCE